MDLQRRAFRRGAMVLGLIAAYAVSPVRPGQAQQDPIDWTRIAQQNKQTYGFQGVISGRVMLDNGKPAVGFLVFARFTRGQSGASGEGGAITDSEGRYRIEGLNPQGFFIQPQNGGQPYLPDPARLVQLDKSANNMATNVNFVLHLGPEVLVQVRDAQTDQPVVGLPIEATQSGLSSGIPAGVTDAKGEFRFRARHMETQIGIDSGQLSERRLSVAPGSNQYRRLELRGVSGNPNVVWKIKTYQETSDRQNVALTGIVTARDSRPVAGAKVRLARSGTSEVLYAVTDALGRFSIPTHRMQSWEYGNSDGRFVRGILIVVEKGALRTAHLATPEETWRTIPVRLGDRQPALLQGRVVSQSGKPLAGVPVSGYEVPEGASVGVQSDFGVTDANGYFKVFTFPGGSYSLTLGRFAQNGNTNRFGITNVPEAGAAGPGLRLKKGEKRNLGTIIVPLADKTLAGRIVESDGKAPERSLLVTVKGKHSDSTVPVEKDGTFLLTGMVSEPLIVSVFQSVKGGYFRTSPGSPDEVARQEVGPKETRVEIVLKR